MSKKVGETFFVRIPYGYNILDIENFYSLFKIVSIMRFQAVWVVYPNFWHPALTSTFTKYKFLQAKNCCATIVNGQSVLKLFQLSNGALIIFDKVLQPNMTKLRQGVEVREHYSTVITVWRLIQEVVIYSYFYFLHGMILTPKVGRLPELLVGSLSVLRFSGLCRCSETIL